MAASTLAHTTHTGAMPAIKPAAAITALNRHEAARLAALELEQVLALLAQLDGDDWAQPTDCTAWNVHDMTAHLAGACAGWATWKDFRRQIIGNPYIRKAGVPVDAINRRQLEDRAGLTPPQLIDELAVVGPQAVRNRKNLPGLLRMIRIAAKPMPGTMSLAYLADVIYPRDQWMHRMDICRATGKELVITPGHDERLLDLVMLDIARKLGGRLALTVHVTGAVTASYQFGSGEPQAELEIDYLALNRRASMRISADEALQTVTVRGEQAIAQDFVRACPVLY